MGTANAVSKVLNLNSAMALHVRSLHVYSLKYSSFLPKSKKVYVLCEMELWISFNMWTFTLLGPYVPDSTAMTAIWQVLKNESQEHRRVFDVDTTLNLNY